MSVKEITHKDNGAIGYIDSTDQWISATQTRNYLLKDPILDWLQHYGESAGFKSDTSNSDYDPRMDHNLFVFAKAKEFESKVVELLGEGHSLKVICKSDSDTARLDYALKTYYAMVEGVDIIYRGVLFNPENGTYGVPDLLIRSDVLKDLFPNSISEAISSIPAPDLGTELWHYCVTDIKFTTLELRVDGTLSDRGSVPAFKAQMHIYNEALGRLQGYLPERSYLLGRSCKAAKGKGSIRCDERLGVINHNNTEISGIALSDLVNNAIDWIRRLKKYGAAWKIIPIPTVNELYPNATNKEDFPWHAAKKEILNSLEELTMLPEVGITARKKGHDLGIYKWTDKSLSAETLGLSGDKAKRLNAVLKANKESGVDSLQPSRVLSNRVEWYPKSQLEFYVDFETVNDLDDDFSTFPEKGGTPLIYMIGCGHMQDETWMFKSFVVNSLSHNEEARIIDTWIAHMDNTTASLSPEHSPLIFHWSPAETSMYATARQRHTVRKWPDLNWYDVLNKVIKTEPVVIQGCLDFGLKSIASEFYRKSFIDTEWKDGPTGGLQAMVGAWFCSRESKRLGIPMSDLELMREIADYNNVDCKVISEILTYLRDNH